jgi:hypothetical protein
MIFTTKITKDTKAKTIYIFVLFASFVVNSKWLR